MPWARTMSPIAFVMRPASPVASASFRYLAIIFGLPRYLVSSKELALGIGQSPFAAIPIRHSFLRHQPHLDQAQSTLAFCSISGPTLAPLISPPTRSAIKAIAPSAQHAMTMKKTLLDRALVVSRAR